MIFKKLIFTATVFTSTVVITTFTSTQNAAAYSTDCAILLCMAGGFPSNTVCNLAYAEVIRRVTPFPIEPPLQVWRCPMGLADNNKTKYLFGNNRYRILPAKYARHQKYSQDISKAKNAAPVFNRLAQIKQDFVDSTKDPKKVSDFITSIKVWDVRQYNHVKRRKKEGCIESYDIRLGTYDVKGNFTWRSTTPKSVPSFMIPNKSCVYDVYGGTVIRAVGFNWNDFNGGRGEEKINY